MKEAEIDRRLGLLLSEPPTGADAAFTGRVLTAALIDRSFERARHRALRRAVLDCAGAITVAVTFFLLSQTEHGSIAGTISLQGPAMAGLIMLGLWATVALPEFAGARPGHKVA